MPELITANLEDYQRLAIALGIDAEKRAQMRQKLADNRLTTPLFDTERFTRRIEAAYTAMAERYSAGLKPDHIVVPD